MVITNIRLGNIYNSDADVVIVTVNCVGFMGKGMALECALRYPEIEQLYKKACDSKEISIGRMYWTKNRDDQQIVLFPTKRDYKHSSKMEYIKLGLISLESDLLNRNITSVAMPRLGAELGGLEWPLVESLILKTLENLDINLELWSLDSQVRDKLVWEIICKLNDDPRHAATATRIPLKTILYIVELSNRKTFSSLADLLNIQGLGKGSIAKLVAWATNDSTMQNSLFNVE